MTHKTKYIEVHSICLHPYFREGNTFICHKLEQLSYQIPERYYFNGPEHIYSFPENYGLERCGLSISEE